MMSNTSPAPTAAKSSPNSYLTILEDAWHQHLVPRQANAPTVISLFAGCGGSSLGYSMAGYQERLAVEWDNNAVETFKLNFPDIPVHHGDIAKLSIDECLKLSGLQMGELDVLDGSPPCQGFSTAGKRVMDDPRNSLFREYVRLLRGLQPKVLIMENVSGMVKGKMKLIFVEILKELKASGYQVKAWLMNAMYFNVPQSRQRVIFIGVRNDLAITPTELKPMNKAFTVRDAISGAIAVSSNRSYVPVWLSANDNPSPTLTKTVGNEKHGMIEIPRRTDTLGNQYADETKTGKSHPKHFSILRIDYDKPANSIPKSVTVNGTSQYLHPVEKRLMSIDELKRLASFPDTWQTLGKFTDQWARIGNSVPPLFMRAIAQHVRKTVLDVSNAK